MKLKFSACSPRQGNGLVGIDYSELPKEPSTRALDCESVRPSPLPVFLTVAHGGTFETSRNRRAHCIFDVSISCLRFSGRRLDSNRGFGEYFHTPCNGVTLAI